MPDSAGKLTSADIPKVQAYFNRNSLDGALTCPVTGQRVPIEKWRISDRLGMIPMSGAHLETDQYQRTPVLCCTSPAGGIVFLEAIAIGLLERASSH